MKSSSERLMYWGVGTFVAGGFCLLTNWYAGPSVPAWVVALAGNLGPFLIATVLLGWLFNLSINRELIGEAVGKTRAVDLVTGARLVGIWSTFQQVDMPAFITAALTLDVFVAYAYSWRRNNAEHLRTMLHRPGSKLNVTLPDFREKQVMETLASRFGDTPENMAKKVRDAAQFYLELGSEASTAGQVTVRLIPVAPLESFYITPSTAVLAGFSHRPGSVLTVRADRGGWLFDYIEAERDAILALKPLEITSLKNLPAL